MKNSKSIIDLLLINKPLNYKKARTIEIVASDYHKMITFFKCIQQDLDVRQSSTEISMNWLSFLNCTRQNSNSPRVILTKIITV